MSAAPSPSSPPPEDRELSPLTGWTRAHWEWTADALLAAVRPHANDSGSLIRLPGPASGSGEWSDGLEGYARTFLLAAFRAAHADPAHAERLLAPYATGLAAGTDPASPAPDARWPRLPEMTQARVEAASIALALHLTRPLLWDRLPAPVRERAVLWLSEMGGVEVPRNNWVWFRAVVAAFLRSVGAPHSADDIAHAIEATEGWYAGGGWYTDGGKANFDHYNGWALHLYPLLTCRISGETDGPLAERYRQRLRAFLDDAQHLVAADGAPLFQGRSLTYRFAAAAPFFTGALFDATPLAPGLTRRVASGMLRHFLDRGAVAEGGLLSLGWHRRFEPIRQIYSGPASPYWASKGFLGLLLPPDHPVWTATESELPVERGDVTRTIAAPGWQVSGTAADGVIRVATPGTPHGKGYAPFYALPAYTTHTAPDLPPAETDDAPVVERRTLHGPWEVRTVPAGTRVVGHTIADAEPPTRHGDGVVRRADGLTSALVPLGPGPHGLSVRRAENANPFGAHSATPVYEGPATTVAVFLGHTADGTLPPALEDVEDALALARLERDRALGRGEAPIPHDEARRALLEAAGRRE
ncbi:DUF2264 domain-containing protein [Streptomyces sp. 6N223]|uniref:DUF2264 domain-containing protein n=1 Tax=Streptomyces sp. 6N223 TaxID=3457412 RepID=UPI003FD14E64